MLAMGVGVGSNLLIAERTDDMLEIVFGDAGVSVMGAHSICFLTFMVAAFERLASDNTRCLGSVSHNSVVLVIDYFKIMLDNIITILGPPLGLLNFPFCETIFRSGVK